MCGGGGGFLGLGSIIKQVTSIFKEPSKPKAPEIEVPETTPSAAALSNMASVGTGGKVQLGRRESQKAERASGGGSGSRGRSALGGVGGGGLRI